MDPANIDRRDNDDDDDTLRYEKSVAFRLSNKPDGTSICLRAAYVSYDEFKPNPETLASMSVFKKCIGLEDFHLVVSAINAQLRKSRSLSFNIGVAALVLTFASVAICVLVSIPGGVSGQALVILLQTALQALVRHRCEASMTAFLEEHVNGRLREMRHMFVVFRVVVRNFSQWCEVDFVSSANVNPLSRCHTLHAMEDELAAPEDGGVAEQRSSHRLEMDETISGIALRQGCPSGRPTAKK